MLMASVANIHNQIFFKVSLPSPKCYCTNQTLSLTPSPLLSSKSLFKLKKQSAIPINKRSIPKIHRLPVVYAAQSNLFKGGSQTWFCSGGCGHWHCHQTVWRVGKDGVEAGTDLVPDSVPRPIARISVAVIGFSLALFVLKSFLSTAFFVLAVMGLSYFAFLALNKDEGPKGGGGTTTKEGPISTEDSLEEARRIMEKYK